MAKNTENVVEETATQKGETKFPLETLKHDCMKLYHVTSSTFAGATATLPDGNYTIEEVGTIIKNWLKKGVK